MVKQYLYRTILISWWTTFNIQTLLHSIAWSIVDYRFVSKIDNISNFDILYSSGRNQYRYFKFLAMQYQRRMGLIWRGSRTFFEINSVDVDIGDSSGMTSLMGTRWEGHLKVANFFLSQLRS